MVIVLLFRICVTSAILMGYGHIASISDRDALPQTVDEVKAMVALRALLFSVELSLSSIILEGDSKIVIKSLLSEEISLASYGYLVDDEAKLLADTFI